MADSESKTRDDVDALLALADEADLFLIVEQISRDPDPEAAAAQFAQLARRLYGQPKHLSAAIAIARAGIQYCLCHPVDVEKRVMLRARAMAMAFNLGANTWPGWGDAVERTASDLDAGLDAARLNLRLAQELAKGPLAESRGHWLIGAQLLARGSDDAAVLEFGHARELASAARDLDNELLMRGYAALVGARRDDSEAHAEFSRSVQALKERTASEDAKFFAEQLETALTIFTPPNSQSKH